MGFSPKSLDGLKGSIFISKVLDGVDLLALTSFIFFSVRISSFFNRTTSPFSKEHKKKLSLNKIHIRGKHSFNSHRARTHCMKIYSILKQLWSNKITKLFTPVTGFFYYFFRLIHEPLAIKLFTQPFIPGKSILTFRNI